MLVFNNNGGKQMTLIAQYARAAYPAVAVETPEDDRVLSVLLGELHTLGEVRGEAYQVATVSATGALLLVAPTAGQISQRSSYPEAFAWAAGQGTPTVLVVYDAQHLISNAGIYRSLKNQLPALKSSASMVVLCAPSWTLPAELRHDVPVISLPLPSRDQLAAALGKVHADLESARGKRVKIDSESLLDAATGLTEAEAEASFALASGASGIKAETVSQEKVRLIRQTKGLEVFPSIPESEVGGLLPLRRYVSEEIGPNRRDAMLRVKGMVLVGPPGTGKSLFCGVTASMLGVPLVRGSIPAMMGGIVGESESNIIAALRIVEAIGQCVLWLDEIDSALGGAASSAQTDGGTIGRVVSMLLTWLQESKSGALVVATANYPERIPPALLRPGRIDAIWSVDLPTATERAEIVGVHLRRLGCEPDGHSAALAAVTQDYSGAELAATVLSAARRTARQVTREALLSAAKEITPLAKSRAEELQRMREWAQHHARAANTPELAAAPAVSRRLI
jgi:ATPase family protein associated with various cellular activities (AAA)